MYRLIVSDIDGTLLRDDKTLGSKTRDAIRRASSLGIRFAICSGRFRSALGFIGEELAVPTIYAAMNGSVVTDGDTYILRNEMSRKLLAGFLRTAASRAECILVFGENNYLIDASDYFYELQAKLYKGYYGKRVTLAEVSLDKIRELLGEPVVKVLIKDRDQRRFDSVVEELSKQGLEADLVLSSQMTLEVIPFGQGKGKAVEAIAAYLGLSKEEVIVFGDYYNDLPMFEAAGMAVAMGNAEADLKAKAGFVTLTNNEDGIAYALEKLVFPDYS